MMNYDHHTDEHFMRRAMELAVLGSGQVSPNPLVGCVVVHDGRIVGEGWHQKFGDAHAEVNAVQAVADKRILSESTLYVNLEPCSHVGKTPPCADMLIKHRVKRVVIANTDTNPLVGGEGIRRLRSAGIEVDTDVLKEQGRELNRRFFTWVEKKRPYIILKWAETADGFMARENYDSKWISNERSRQLVHKWRAHEDGILVGSKTVAVDNPRLNVRDWSGRNPVRIVIDRFLKLKDKRHVFDASQKTLCYNLIKQEENFNLEFIRLDEKHFFNNLISDLYKRGIQSLIIEGGTQTLNLFIQNNLWDEARIFISDKSFNKGINAPHITGILKHQEVILNDMLRIFSPIHA